MVFVVRSKVADKTEKVTATIPRTQKRALDQMAKDNGRSTASEIRLAIFDRLKKDGRIL